MSLEDALRRVRARVAERYPEVLRQREIRHLEALWDLPDGDVIEGGPGLDYTAPSASRKHHVDDGEYVREAEAHDDPPVVPDALA